MQQQYSHNQQKMDALLSSDLVTEPTRKALLERVEKAFGKNKFFNDYSFNLLSVICDLLVDQDSQHRVVNIAFFIDERLTNKTCDGWRYNSMPPDDIMYKIGLEGIDETASEIFGRKFIALKKEEQIKVLNAIQKGNVVSDIWTKLPPAIFFEELLAETAEIFFSYPLVQADIDYVGMADAKGWSKIGLNEA
ncbi:MAG: gluconate 2-dehydrogenase subunit 3 family protein [Segetibacter sp.]